MAEHTPGDWGIFENGNEEEAVVVSYGDHAHDIAYLKREDDQEWAEVEANARLIAAAPLLLAALEAVAWTVMSTDGPRLCWCAESWDHRPAGHAPVCEQARAALAAATGGQTS